jgi:class 3 adenylate cyclase
MTAPAFMHPVTLRFAPGLEDEFRAAHFRASLRGVRLLLAAGAILYGAVFLAFDYRVMPADAFRTVSAIRLTVSALLLVALGTTYRAWFQRWWQDVMSASLLAVAASVALMVITAPHVPMLRDVLAPAFLIYLMVAFVIARLYLLRAVVTGVLLVGIYNVALFVVGGVALETVLGNNMMLSSAVALGTIAAYLLERHVRGDYMHARLLDAERQRADGLLLSILPPAIAERLKREPGTIADWHEDVTVVFADICGFTELAAKAAPGESVALLNRIFSAFDRLADRHGLEKIKTIGDSYMAAGGLANGRSPGRGSGPHAEAAADLALGMQAELAELNRGLAEPLFLRIGIHTGPVVAGVIGLRRFSYDLWGDTVNTASRMESHGIPGAIQVSEATGERLRSSHTLEERGTVEVKGKGAMRTFLLLGRKAPSMPAEPFRAGR